MKKPLLAVVLGGVVLFLWGFISWAVLPWHDMVANKFSDEAAVAQVLKANAPVQGIYYLPYAEEDHKPGEVAAFVNVLPQGFDMNMGKLMGIGLTMQILSAALVFGLLRQTQGLSYLGKLKFVAWVGLTIGFVSHGPYWNWFGFSTSYTIVTILDILIGGALASLVIARFAEENRPDASFGVRPAATGG
ncbi:MAG: hypothetical protein HY204_10910 [Nitrospirae bacterium]|nr:hypothetical protein [Nitrospirota bacterium]